MEKGMRNPNVAATSNEITNTTSLSTKVGGCKRRRSVSEIMIATLHQIKQYVMNRTHELGFDTISWQETVKSNGCRRF